MNKTANFSVDPRLASILGENYSSSERALRELVDNAWDAEATAVRITLPDILNESPIIIADNGSGMKEQEMRQEYLNIASPRYTRKGEKTPNLQRTVKGRRGIGKFAGLILASQMEVETKSHGTQTRLVISKTALLNAGKDIEQVPLPIETAPCKKGEKGTIITLTNLNQNLNFPKADKLKEIIAYDYGRETGFEVFINGEQVLRHDIQGQAFTKEYTLPNGKKATVNYTVSDKPVPSRKAGLILRVGDKAVGNLLFCIWAKSREVP
jgi:HSP90 family molecular chaperone